MIDSRLLTRLKRVNRLRAMIGDGVSNAKEVLEEADRVLSLDMRSLGVRNTSMQR